MASKRQQTDDILGWLNAPDDAPPPEKKKKRQQSVRAAEQDRDSDDESEEEDESEEQSRSVKGATSPLSAVAVAPKDTVPPCIESKAEEDRDSHRLFPLLLLRLQLDEQQTRCELQQTASSAFSGFCVGLLTSVMHYVREREQTLICDNNKRLIANDLISELVAGVSKSSEELGTVLGLLGMMRSGGGAAAAVSGTGSAAPTLSSSSKKAKR